MFLFARGQKAIGVRTYTVGVSRHEDAMRVLQATKLIDRYGEIEENLSLAQNVVIMQSCCKRAFIRGAFLASGSISDPEKFYHFEIVCAAEAKAVQLQVDSCIWSGRQDCTEKEVLCGLY